MITERIDLYEYFGLSRPAGAAGYLNVYVHFQSPEYCTGRLRPAMVVFPGGGYEMLSDREKEPIALAFMVNGFNAFTVEYSLRPLTYPTQLIEGVMAVLYVKLNAEKYNLDIDKVAGIGFSAGGHLLGTVANMYDHEDVCKVLGERCKLAKLNGCVYSYPVVSSGENAHVGSIMNLTAGDSEKIAKVSVDKNITENSSPAFIWTTADDACVPAENSFMLASAYKKLGLPFELHVFQSGIHGLSLSTKETCSKEGNGFLTNDSDAKWLDLAVTFLKNNGFEIKQ